MSSTLIPVSVELRDKLRNMKARKGFTYNQLLEKILELGSVKDEFAV